jgi:hypothetical protein
LKNDLPVRHSSPAYTLKASDFVKEFAGTCWRDKLEQRRACHHRYFSCFDLRNAKNQPRPHPTFKQKGNSLKN